MRKARILASGLPTIFFKSSTFAIGSAAINLITTIVLVRWFGADPYSRYIVDLSVISLIFIVNEIVPSNYSIFKAQDDPMWLRSLASYSLAAVFTGMLLIFVISKISGVFQAYSSWMLAYGASLAIKRYMDTRLQSSGRLSEFMKIEFFGSFYRLIVLFVMYMLDRSSTDSIWASLAIGALASQMLWWIKNPLETHVFKYSLYASSWKSLILQRNKYFPYYAGTCLKKAKDNLVPLVAGQVFISREVLASFFLAYRGLLFSIGQVRILEALINHRTALSIVDQLRWKKKIAIALSAQILCLTASAGIILLSGTSKVNWLDIIALSSIIWPAVFLILERAKAYSSFRANVVNKSILAYLITATCGSLLLILKENASIFDFAVLLFSAEMVACAMIKFGNKNSKVQ